MSIQLWTLRHPDAENGWIYLTEQEAKKALIAAEKRMPEMGNLKLSDFIIEPYEIMTPEIITILRNNLPELFL